MDQPYTIAPLGPHFALILGPGPHAVFVRQSDAEREGQRLTQTRRTVVITAPMPVMLRIARAKAVDTPLIDEEV